MQICYVSLVFVISINHWRFIMFTAVRTRSSSWRATPAGPLASWCPLCAMPFSGTSASSTHCPPMPRHDLLTVFTGLYSKFTTVGSARCALQNIEYKEMCVMNVLFDNCWQFLITSINISESSLSKIIEEKKKVTEKCYFPQRQSELIFLLTWLINIFAFWLCVIDFPPKRTKSQRE